MLQCSFTNKGVSSFTLNLLLSSQFMTYRAKFDMSMFIRYVHFYPSGVTGLPEPNRPLVGKDKAHSGQVASLLHAGPQIKHTHIHTLGEQPINL